MKSIKSQEIIPTPKSIPAQPSIEKSEAAKLNESIDNAHTHWLPGFDPAPRARAETGEEFPATSNLASDSDPITTSAISLPSVVAVRRVTVVSIEKQRISGLQHFTTAAETVCASANAIRKVLNDHAYQYIETTAAGVEIQHLLSSVGRSKLIWLTGLDRTTVRLAINTLKKRHLVELHVPADPYLSKPAIYRLYDAYVAAERMRVEDGIATWRQRGRGRVVCPPLGKVLNRE